MKEMYGDQFGEFVCGYWGLKGLTLGVTCTFSGKSNSGEDQSNSAGMKPISDKHQTHSTYNGDVSANENQGLLGKKLVSYLCEVKRLPLLKIWHSASW